MKKQINQIWHDMLAELYKEHEDLYILFQNALPLTLTPDLVNIAFYDSYENVMDKLFNSHDKNDLIQWCFQQVAFPVKRIKYYDIRELEKETQKDSRCESPIEELFFEACRKYGVEVMPQYEIGRYRIDFVMPEQKVAIELDGHDYHKTKAQRTNDTERERYLQKQGWQVIRFTGTEIYKNVQQCVQDVIDIIAV